MLFPVVAGVVDTSGAPGLFSKKFEITLMLFSGGLGMMSYEKNPEAKNLVTLFHFIVSHFAAGFSECCHSSEKSSQFKVVLVFNFFCLLKIFIYLLVQLFKTFDFVLRINVHWQIPKLGQFVIWSPERR
jgi:hypothetical protein